MEDHGVAVFSFGDDAVAIIEDSWIANEGDTEFRSTLYGSEGSLSLPVPWVPTGEVLNHLIDCARQGYTPAATVADAVDNLRICFGFYEAAKSGSVMNLDSPGTTSGT